MRSLGQSRLALFAAAAFLFIEGSSHAQPNWIHRSPAVSPSARMYHAMAYDAGRRRVVLFGGLMGSQVFNDTWEWDGTTWVQRLPTVSPPSRSYHVMAYDASRNRVVLFGGLNSSVAYNDTWEWDGMTWTRRTSTVMPPSGSGHAMAYDAFRKRTVLFGGGFNDTWEWDGTTWMKRAPTARPPARYGNAMAYDAARKRVFIFGGALGGPIQTRYNDTWEWDGTTWTQRTPAERPPNLSAYYVMAYDTARRRGVLFPAGALNTTWEWDGTTWTERVPPTMPLPRNGHAMAHDASRLATVIFGGMVSGTGYVNETWTYGFSAGLIQSGAARPGSTVSLQVNAPGEAGRTYQVGSSLGTGPIMIGGRPLGLGPDPLLAISVAGTMPWIFRGYRGAVDPGGSGTAAITIPNQRVLIGITIHSAFITLNPIAPQGIQSVSNTASFQIL